MRPTRLSHDVQRAELSGAKTRLIITVWLTMTTVKFCVEEPLYGCVLEVWQRFQIEVGMSSSLEQVRS
jgi:hypothetical protein